MFPLCESVFGLRNGYDPSKACFNFSIGLTSVDKALVDRQHVTKISLHTNYKLILFSVNERHVSGNIGLI